MFMNLLSLTVNHCPKHLLLERSQVLRLLDDLSDYLGLQPVSSPTVATVASNPLDAGLAGFALAANGYLHVRTWSAHEGKPLSLNLGMQGAFEYTPLLTWIQSRLDVQKQQIVVKLATQGVSVPATSLSEEEILHG